MREIKFRAQNDVGNWIEFTLEGIYPPLDFTKIKNICQFTSKRDKNSNEIYDGHILKYENPEYPDHKPYVVRWSEEDCGFECVNDSNFMLPSVWCEMEIIGNIFENPDLLEDK